MNAAALTLAPHPAPQVPHLVPLTTDRPAALAPVIPLRPNPATPEQTTWLDEDELSNAQLAAVRASVRRQLPAPIAFARSVAMAVLEIEAGSRSALQLERRCTPEAWAQVDRELHRSGGAFVDGHAVIRVHCQELRPGVADAVVVVRRGRRVAAVAMRVEAIRDRWTVTELRF